MIFDSSVMAEDDSGSLDKTSNYSEDELGDSDVESNVDPDRDNYLPMMDNDFMTYQDIDDSHDQTPDNIDHTAGFFTTLAGDIPVSIEDRPGMDRVSGHVLYNQAAACCTRYEKRINGTKAQQHFIQRLASTTPGDPCPLLSLEQCMHTRIFPFSSSSDSISILGALPTWIYGTKTHTNGFASFKDMLRSRLTASGSLTSSDPHYMRFMYDLCANHALNHDDSRQIMKRGFQVDTSTKIGLSSRGKNESGLSECIDSQEMVRGLVASQEWITYDYFITFTCNHSQSPGISYLHQWKQNINWADHYPNFNDIPSYEQSEIKRSFDESSGPIILRNWIEIRKIFLKHLKHSLSLLGIATEALFSRDEYQDKSGNVFHEHLVGAFRKWMVDRLGKDFWRNRYALIFMKLFVQMRSTLLLVKAL